MRRFMTLLAVCEVVVSCSLVPPGPADGATADRDIMQAQATIDADDMLRHIRVLASDAFEGRGAGTHGEQLTVDYLVDEFKRFWD